MDVTFEWDVEKARINLAKHRVGFGDACFAILDPYHLEEIDDRFEYDEERLQIIGLSSLSILFVVTIAHAENHYRIISARRAEGHEADRYFSGKP
jgi:uncharacterized DUF497 family protein